MPNFSVRTQQFDRLTIEPNRFGGFTVYGHGTYEETSVLAGQYMRVRLRAYGTVEDALAEYPAAQVVDFSTRADLEVGALPPTWFDPSAAGERWEDD